MRYKQAWKEHSDAQLERIRNSQSSKDSAVLKIFGVEEGRSGGQRRFQNQRIPKGDLRLAAALDGQQDQGRINLDYGESCEILDSLECRLRIKRGGQLPRHGHIELLQDLGAQNQLCPQFPV